ncbi:uncharacterized protein LOC100908985 [Galendromus occidentalis]|uniref:Uncharacterized protein LOC100908985 n=1 Tax=Galendromus occidentalis TaxID=34638 RepID=A0AAJ6VZ92_9ACAR|nr:uncharacterized protein LOC100908985 [Galendromus occidentalis]
MKLLTHFLALSVGLLGAVREAQTSVELSSLGNPKCDPPGRWRTGRRLNFTESRAKGAIVNDNGVSWLTKLEDCANWCCRLPPVNCSVAMLEIRSNGANCHLLVCYPTELCVFNYAPDFLSYDRTLFVPPVTDIPLVPTTGRPSFSFRENTQQHKSVIKPRKGVEDLLPETLTSSTRSPASLSSEKPIISSSALDDAESRPHKHRTSVGLIFLYAAIILAIMGVGTFFGLKFLDCWERRHYTRADYLLDGMYEIKGTSCSS